MGGPQGTPAPIDGTFALSHQLFFESFLLPNLQVFVQQSQIYPKKAEFTNNGSSIKANLGYILGANPDKDPYNDSANPIYRFQLVPAKDGQPSYYSGHVDVIQEIVDEAKAINSDIIVLCHGGPIAKPEDARYVLDAVVGIHGFFGASSMERLPVEEAIVNVTKEFKDIQIV